MSIKVYRLIGVEQLNRYSGLPRIFASSLTVSVFPVPCGMVLPFKYVDLILHCNNSNESFSVVIFCDSVYCALQGGSSGAKQFK